MMARITVKPLIRVLSRTRSARSRAELKWLLKSRLFPAAGRRRSYVAGDFFASVPQGADLYFLCGVAHDWEDERAVTILRNCREAISTTGRLLLLETVVPGDDSKHFGKILDLNMLAMSSGRERTRAEFCTILGAAGFKMSRIITTMAPQSLIEAIPQ